MCEFDIRAARRTRSVVYSTITNIAIPANPNRIAVTVIALVGDNANLQVANANGQGNLGGAGLVTIAHDDRSANQSAGGSNKALLAVLGDIVLGDLVLNSTNGTGAIAIEAILDIELPQLNNQPNFSFIPGK